jgi:alpha-galactosidase
MKMVIRDELIDVIKYFSVFQRTSAPLRKKPLVILGIAIAFLFFVLVPTRAQNPAPRVHAADDGLALTPPMGWYPWNEFGQEPQNEKLIKEIVDALVSSGLKEAGYAYVGPDEGICFYRDAGGMLTTNLERYPSGLRGLGDYIHKKGLKYALYTDAGSRTCSKAMPGTKDHELEDMVAFAQWRADYIKIDWCNTEGQDVAKTYTKLRDAQHAAGRPIVYSLCSWGEGEPWKWAAAVGHLWRTGGDICSPGKADWGNAMKIAAANERLNEAAGPGHWNDPDMMIAGMDGLSETQNRSFFSLWCMMAAPLMAGNDLRKMTMSTIRILTNLEAIGINQDPLGIQGRIVRRNGKVEIWAGKRLFDGSQAVLVFNQGAAPADVQVVWSDIGIPESAALYVRNLWTHQTIGPHRGGSFVTVAPNDVALLRISKTNAFPVPPIIVADSYLVSLRAAGPASRKLTGAVIVKTHGSDELPLWKVRPDLPSWLSVTVTGNGKSQTLTNTLSTAGLKKGLYHALVRADNIEPISGKPMSSLYYDVDLEVTSAAGSRERN